MRPDGRAHLSHGSAAIAAPKRAATLHRSAAASSLGARLFHFLVHARIGRSDEGGDDVVAPGDRVVAVAAALEEIGGRHLVAPLQGIVTMSKPLPSPVRFIISNSAAVSITAKPFAVRQRPSQSASGSAQGPDIEIEIDRMEPSPFWVPASASC